MKKSILQFLKETCIETVASVLIAVGIYNFAVASEFPMTGFSGISMILYRLFHLPIGLTTVILNVPVAILCYKLLGRKFFLRSIRCLVISSFMIDYLAPLLPIYQGDRMISAQHAGAEGGEHPAAGIDREEGGHVVDHEGRDQDAPHGAQEEFPAQEAEAEDRHRYVQHDQHQSDGQTEEPVQDHGDAGEAGHGEFGRHGEVVKADGDQDTAQGLEGDFFQNLFQFFQHDGASFCKRKRAHAEIL